MDVELVARASLSSLQKDAGEGLIVSFSNLDDWTWSGLRKQFKFKSLEKLFSIYQRKIQNGYLSLFVLLQLMLGIVHCSLLLTSVSFEEALPDMVVNFILAALLCPVITLSFRSDSVKSKNYLQVILSCTVVTLLVISDISIPVYYTLAYNEEMPALRPAYMTHILLVCYLFLPLTENLYAFVLGITSTMCYIVIMIFITYKDMPHFGQRITTDIIYFVCINILGLYFRYMNEVFIRKSFLDRRKCVESTLRLNYEKDQEEQLTRSILPPHFAAKIKKDFKNIFKFIEVHKKLPSTEKPYTNLYVETHNNVSILYADVVNFSGLTITLPVQKLIETLNDLFGNFDDASEQHNVLRIKFLGDCYYCVSGVPVPNPQHAKSCVDLGLDMINIIEEVRTKVHRENGVDVNMRIGVHSGKIISGILGTNKWQYDVWSRDVAIANKMEQSGKPGKVHITQNTLELLDVSQYDCELATTNDEILEKYGINKTYLITPTKRPKKKEIFETVLAPNFESGSSNKHYVRWSCVKPANSIGASLKKSKRHTLATVSNQTNDNIPSRRRTHFMDSYLKDYHLILKAADVEMEKAIKQMPLSKWEEWSNWEHIHPLFMTFQNFSWEAPFIREPDPLFKSYIACAFVVLCTMIFIFLIPVISASEWHGSTFSIYVITMLFLMVLLPCTWMNFLWNHYKDPLNEYEGSVPAPRNKFLLALYQISIKIVWCSSGRTILYLLIAVALNLCATFQIMVECDNSDALNSNNISNVIVSGAAELKCVPAPWQITQTFCLTILASFLFLRIHFALKLFAAMSNLFFYMWVVWSSRRSVFQSGDTTNPYMDPRLAHLLNVAFLSLSLHLIDRQAEYLCRLDYQWKRQLTKEQDKAYHTRTANKILLRNILPEHVAEFYLNMNRTEDNELYYEAHANVAVMFATLTELCVEESDTLIDLNEIICAFDKLLYDPAYSSKVEKIKIAGTTYMAACGLESYRRDSTHIFEYEDYDHQPEDNVVKIMAEFAAQMIAVLDKMTTESFPTCKPYKLRVGISQGEVTAGVVGAQKPLYDIWGDAVNMASRMDTTGIPGKIQVPAATALVLQNQGIECELRGETYVKPKGLVTTYFIKLEENSEVL